MDADATAAPLPLLLVASTGRVSDLPVAKLVGLPSFPATNVGEPGFTGLSGVGAKPVA